MQEQDNPKTVRIPDGPQDTRPLLLRDQEDLVPDEQQLAASPISTGFGESSHRNWVTARTTSSTAEQADNAIQAKDYASKSQIHAPPPPLNSRNRRTRRLEPRAISRHTLIATFNIRGMRSARLPQPEKVLMIPRIMRTEKLGILALHKTHKTTKAMEAMESLNDEIWRSPTQARPLSYTQAIHQKDSKGVTSTMTLYPKAG